MIENYKILTVTHRTLNVEEIGHFVIKYDDKVDLTDRLKVLKQQYGVEEIMYLSTCNRVTYLMYSEDFDLDEDLRGFFSVANPELTDKHLDKIHKFVSTYQGADAIRHLYELSSSIDSLVVGEREIFRQFREAYASARDAGLTGDKLRLLERSTVRTAKEVYAGTRIGEKPLSIVSLAIQQFKASGLSKDSRILMVGAGETNTLVGKFLKKYGYTNVVVFNRSIDNARKLTDLLGGDALHLSELPKYADGFDAMFVCTGATEAIINEQLYKSLVKLDRNQKVIVDLSVPRNVSEAVVADYDVQYIDIEQLRVMAENNLNHRKAEVKEAQKILRAKMAEFVSIYQQRQLERALGGVSAEVKAVKERALHSVYDKQISELDEPAKELLLEMMDYMEKKFVSIPMRLAKQSIKAV